MKAFRSKTLGPPTLVRTSAKIKKLKRMLAEKAGRDEDDEDDETEDEEDEVEERKKKKKKKRRREETALAVYEGGKSMKKKKGDDDEEVTLVVKRRQFDPHDFDPKTLLHDELMEVVGLLETARNTYRDLPDGENASSLAMLLREMRGFVGDLYQITQEDKDTVFKKMDVEIIQPFLKRLVKGVITELDSARRQLLMSFGEEKGPEITSALKSAGRNMSATFSSEYVALMKEVAKTLEVEDVQQIMDRLNSLHFSNSTPGPQKKEEEP